MKNALAPLVLVSATLALSACNKDADFESFVAANKEFVVAVKDAASASPEKAREVFDAGKGPLRAKLDKLKGLRSFQVKEKAAKEFESNVTSSLDEVCHLDLDTICSEYKSLLTAE